MNVQDVLNDKVAQELLASKEMASLAYTWRDGTPRAVPIWFQWTGTQVVMCSPVNAPKMKVLESRPEVAVSIYNNTWPYHALYLRGTVKVERFDGVAPDLVGISEHYAGPDFANAWISQNRASGLKWARIELAPTYAALIDCETRFPSASSAVFRSLLGIS